MRFYKKSDRKMRKLHRAANYAGNTMKAFSIIILLFLIGCNKAVKDKDKSAPVAKVYNEVLYTSQIADVTPSGISAEDSTAIIKDYIDKWIRSKLLLYQAEQNLLPEDKNVERQIEDYRNSLLIFKYEQKYITEKLDTNIAEAAISEYYNNYSSNFILNNNLLKGIFIKVPRNAPQLWKLKSLYRSENPDIRELEHYCFNHASQYLYFEENWKYFNEILKDMPPIGQRQDNILKYRKYYEIKDSTYYYYVKISDYRLEGSITPLELVREDIKSILLNKRKIQLIHELETRVYNDAINRGNFEIYE